MLNDDELNKFALAQGFHLTYHLRDFARAIETALLAEQEKAEPVAWAAMLGGYAHIEWGSKRTDDALHNTPLYLHPAPAPEGMVLDVDWLSNVIRAANGENKLGAGALAEKIIEAIATAEKEYG